MIEGMGKKGFENTGKVVDALEQIGERLPGSRVLEHIKIEEPTRRDWAGEAEIVFAEQNALKTRTLIYIILIIFACLIAWTAVAPLDEVVNGSGRVVTASGTQVVQSIDGGIVEEILVKESQKVEKGDVMLRIDQTRYSSNYGERQAQTSALAAKIARLEALTRETPFTVDPAIEREIPHIVDHERNLFESARNEMQSSIKTAKEQLTQRQQELVEARARLGQLSSVLALATRELEATKRLLESGAVSTLEVIRLEKDVATARGDRNQANAQVTRTVAAIEEASGQVRDTEHRFMNAWKNELSAALRERESLMEGNKALADRVSQSDIRAPITGTVKRLLVNTTGAVVMPGGTIAEVVADEDDVAVEAQLAPNDRAFVEPGQRVVLKFTAYEYAIYGGLEGVVEYIGPDTVTDERGNSFYTVRIKPEKTSFGENKPILPGMVAQVDIITGKKTILTYILKPLFRAKERALREHR